MQRELQIRILVDKAVHSWKRYELNQLKDQIDELEMTYSLTDDSQLGDEEYQMLTFASGVVKKKLFNLVGTYLNETGQVMTMATAEILDKEGFRKFLEEFKETFGDLDPVEQDMVEIYNNSVSSAERHMELRL